MDRIITQRFQQQRDNLIGERVVVLAGGDRLRAKVRRNFFDGQSDAGLDVWTSVGWSRALTLPMSEMEVSQDRPSDKTGLWKEHADNDLDLLEDLGRDFVRAATVVDKVQALRSRTTETAETAGKEKRA